MQNRFDGRPDAGLNGAATNRFSGASSFRAMTGDGLSTASSVVPRATGWARSLSSDTRTLVVLIENGGIDLGIPAVVDRLLSAVPAASSIPDGYRQKLVDYLHEKIVALTNSLIETAELSINRYTAAKPAYFGDVVVLRDGTASYEQLKDQLFTLSRAGRTIDLLILTHGSNDFISVTGGITGQRIREMRSTFGKPLSIRSVYMMNCVGSSLNQAWLDAGAKASSGALRNNYLPEPTTYFFWQAWKEGQAFDAAVSSAYRKTIDLMDQAVRGFVSALPMPLDLLASSIDFNTMDFVKDSAPVIQGDGHVTIASDDLVFSQSVVASRSLAMTVLPLNVLRSMALEPQSPSRPTTTARVVSAQGVAFIKARAPFNAKVHDLHGHCAIGYGTPLHHGKCDGRAEERRYADGIGEEAASQLLLSRVRHCEDVLNDVVTVALGQNQVDALASFLFSIGHRRFRESTLLTLVNRGDLASVPPEIRKWTKTRRDGALVDVPALVERRTAEAELFAKPDGEVQQSLDEAGILRRRRADEEARPSQVAQASSIALPALRARTVLMQSFASPFGFSATDWEPLISFRPPVAIQKSVQGKGIHWHVQRIEDAHGDVNLDYYPITVSTLPTIDGKVVGPDELLSYIRLHLDDFVDTRISQFSPYDADEAKVWRSSAPLGSVVHIEMKAFGGWVNPDDGSVVVAETGTDQWTFTTIWTVMDMAHPVSGNRRFGYAPDAGGGYVFYTRGADRTTGLLDLAAATIVYSSAHNLWLSFQSGVESFVNAHGGVAAAGNATSIRTPWPDIARSSHHPTVGWV